MSKKFSIGFVTPRLDLVGGGEVLIIELLKRLKKIMILPFIHQTLI